MLWLFCATDRNIDGCCGDLKFARRQTDSGYGFVRAARTLKVEILSELNGRGLARSPRGNGKHVGR